MSNSPYINHFLSADTVIPSYTNPQDLNRYSYVNNDPIRYSDPTGHMRVGDDDLGQNKASMNCSKNPQYCSKGKAKSSAELTLMRLQRSQNRNNGSAPFVTVKSQPTLTATPSYLPFSGQHCTGENPCLNNVVPSVTPTATSTSLPLLSSQDIEDFKDLVQYAGPPNPLQPSFAPNIDDVWNSLPNALPLINHPAVSSDTIVNSIVDRATKVVEVGSNVLVNYGQYIISSGISPTIPIVPYVPYADPFAPVYQ